MIKKLNKWLKKLGFQKVDHPIDAISQLYLDWPPFQLVIPNKNNNSNFKKSKIYGNNFDYQFFNIFQDQIYIGKNVQIGPYSFLRGPCIIGDNVKIGPYCEITRSIIMNNTVIAHKNIIPDSIIGENSWLAGMSTICNMRLDKKNIKVYFKNKFKKINKNKFGAIIGHNVKIGVNVFLMPGSYIASNTTYLGPNTIHKNGIII
jgi:NDP-sugar pyrophosphorylase family protein